eukprot:Nk52_evm12s257 gene=Nk52_evmTU12s257
MVSAYKRTNSPKSVTLATLALFALLYHPIGAVPVAQPLAPRIPQSALSSANVTWYTSGAFASYSTWSVTKRAIAGIALQLYSRLPANKTGMNVSFVLQNIDPNSALNENTFCNKSRIQDVCTAFLLHSLLTTGQLETIPLFWPELVLSLTFLGSPFIVHFNKYGCVESVSLSRTGVDLVTIPKDACPPLASLQDDDTPLSSDSSNCWQLVYSSSFFTKDAWARCILENPVLEIVASGLLISGSNAYVKWKTGGVKEVCEREKSILEDDLQRQFSDNSFDISTFEKNLQRTEMKLEARQNYITNAEDVITSRGKDNIANLKAELKSYDGKIENTKYAMKKWAKEYKQLEKENKALVKDLNELEGRIEAQSDIMVYELIDDYFDLQSANINIPNDEVQDQNEIKDRVQNACDSMSRTSVTDSFSYDVGTCTMEMEDISGNALGNDAITNANLVSNQDVVDEFVGQYPELDNLVGRDASLETSDTVASAFGKGFQYGVYFSTIFEAVGGLVNMIIMFHIAENYIEDMVREINHYLLRGFNATEHALESLAIQQQKEFEATMDTVSNLVTTIDSELDCHSAWEEFRNKERQNNHWNVYLEMANAAKSDWKESLPGAYIWNCARMAIVSKKMAPDQVANFLEHAFTVVLRMTQISGLLYQWTASIMTGYSSTHPSSNATNADYSSQVLQGLDISVNNTKQLKMWLVTSVVPPAIAGYLSPKWWTSVGLPPPSMLHYQIQPLNISTWSPRGHLAASLWLPEVEAADANKHTTFADGSNTSTKGHLDPPSFQVIKVTNVTNATEYGYKLCREQNCYHRICECVAKTLEECVDGECSYVIEFSFSSQRPARGWVGVYSNSSAPSESYLPPGLSECSTRDTGPGDVCLPGMLIQNLPENRIKLWANTSYSLHFPTDDQWEYTRLLQSDTTGHRAVKDTLLLQMWESDWAWKYGDDIYSDYLSKYFAEKPSYIENLYTVYSNASHLGTDDQWRFHWALSDGLRHYPIHVKYAHTVFNSNSTFGFSCPQGLSPTDDDRGARVSGDAMNSRENGCSLTQKRLAYPPHL